MSTITIDNEICTIDVPDFKYSFNYESIHFDNKFYCVREDKNSSFMIGKELVVHYNKANQTNYPYEGVLTITSEKIVNTPYPIAMSQMMFNPHCKRYNFIHELLEYGQAKNVLVEEFVEDTDIAQKYWEELKAFHEDLNKRFWTDVMSQRLSPKDVTVICKILQLLIKDEYDTE